MARKPNKNGTIWVRLNERKQHFVFEIENTCDVLPDVPPEKLFERFYRADKTRHYGEGKCGIGLSIAKAIVDSHNGIITTMQRRGDVSRQKGNLLFWYVFCLNREA